MKLLLFFVLSGLFIHFGRKYVPKTLTNNKKLIYGVTAGLFLCSLFGNKIEGVTTKGYCPAGTENIGDFVPDKITTNDDPTSVTDYQIDENLTIHCKKCDVGTYSPMRGSKCLPCPEGKKADDKGSTECSPCPDHGGGNQCIICPQYSVSKNGSCQCIAGYGSNSDKTRCTICPQHSFSKNGVCVPCPDGKFTWGKGATECLQCMAEGVNKDSYDFGRCHR